MMDHNNGDHGPFNKLIFEWIDPLIAKKGYTYEATLESYSLDTDGKNSALLIPYSYASIVLDGNIFNEYLLIIYYTLMDCTSNFQH